MNDSAKLWVFILLLPLLAAIGYDLYTNFYKNEENRAKIEALQIEPEAFMASDFGYLFVTHTPSFYDNAKRMVGEETWKRWVDPVLQQYTTVVAAVPFAVFMVWLLIAKIFDIWPFGTSGGGGWSSQKSAKGKNDDDPFNRRSNQTFKYKKR